MLFFEIKKLFKKKTIPFVIISSIIMGLFINLYSKEVNIEKKHSFFVDDDSYYIATKYIIKDLEKKDMSLDKFVIRLDNINSYYDKEIEIKNNPNIYLSKNQAMDLQKERYEQLKFLDKYIKDNNIVMDDKDKVIYDWSLFEHEYAIKENILARSTKISNVSSNFSRVIIYNSDILFGIIPIILMGILCHDLISGEIDEGQINLLFTQTYSKSRIFIAKLLSIFIMFFLYGILAISFTFLFSFLFGSEIGGFKEIYPIYLNKSSWTFISADKLFFKILFYYLINASFFSIVFLLISKHSNSKFESFSKIFAFILIANLLTKNIDILKIAINPFYLINYMNNVTGYLNIDFDLVGNYSFNIISKRKEIFIYGILLLTFFLIIIDQLLDYKIKSTNKLSFYKSLDKFDFEMKKIIFNKSTYTYLFTCVIFMISILSIFVYKDRKIVTSYTNEKGILKTYKDIYEASLLREKKLKEKFIADNKTLSEKDLKKSLDDFLEPLRNSLEKEKFNYENLYQQIKAFNKKDARTYYDKKSDEIRNLSYTNTGYSPIYLRGDVSKTTKAIHQLTYEEASKKSDTPILNFGRMHSEYDEFQNIEMRNKIVDEASYKSHSGCFFLYRIFNDKYFDIIILIVISLVSFSAYTSDKESNKGIYLIFTQPLEKSRYYLKRIIFNLMTAYILTLLIIILGFLMGSIFEGVGDVNFPIAIHKLLIHNPDQISIFGVLESIYLIPIWKYLLKLFIIICIELMFLGSLMQLISVFIINKKEQLATIFLIGLGSILLEKLLKFNFIKIINPFNYLKATFLANNGLMIIKNNSITNFTNGLIILTIWSLLFIVLGMRFIKNHPQKTY